MAVTTSPMTMRPERWAGPSMSWPVEDLTWRNCLTRHWRPWESFSRDIPMGPGGKVTRYESEAELLLAYGRKKMVLES
jgi:hypothetical protein